MKTIATILVSTLFTSCMVATKITGQHCKDWEDCIYNPANKEFVDEVAFHQGIKPSEVSQAMFNDRYVIEVK